MTLEFGQKPSFYLPFLEPFRAMGELAMQPAGNRLFGFAPDGDQHPVLTLPGFLGSDGSTALLRRFLISKNYRAYPWKLGRNNGPHSSGEHGELLDNRIIEIFEETGEKVSLVGWSLGGVMARNAARRIPDKVRQVITLGSPFDATLTSTSIAPLFRLVSGRDPTDEEFQVILDYNRPPPPEEIPTTSIFTKTDGIVHWRTCVERPAPNTDNIEVYASHLGLGFSPVVHYLLAERLAVPVEEWSPFDRAYHPWRRVTFPSAGHSYGF